MTERMKGVLFDKDGTLIDFARTWVPINVEAAGIAAGGDPALRDRLLRVAGHDPETNVVAGGSLFAASNTEEIVAAWREAGAVDDGTLVARMDAIFTEGAKNSVPVTDLPALFERLRARGLALGVATSDSAAGAAATLAALGVVLDDLFVAGYDSGHGAKPTAGMALAFAAAHGLDPAEIAVVGDNLHDIHMGRAAGCGLCVGVLTGTASQAELAAEADHVLPGINALEDLFDRLDLWPAGAPA